MLEKLASSRFYSYVLVLIIGLITLLAKFYLNGIMYGLDYSLFHPDGTLYTFRTLTWLGNSQEESSRLISSWYTTHAGKMTNVIPESLYFDSNPNWQLYKYRVLYSFISIPFVFFFGIYGMLFVPAISYIGLLIVILEIGRHYNKPEIAFILIILFSMSITITRWMFINTTDSLFVFLASLSTYLLVKWSPTRNWFFMQLVLVAAMSSTRVAIFYWIPICAVLFLKNRKQAILLGLVSVFFFAPLFRANIVGTIGASSKEGSFFHQALSFFRDALKVLVVEFGQLLVLDRVLLFLAISAFIVSIAHLQNDSSRYFLALLTSTLLMSILNGTVGVNFRFELPILASLTWVLLEITPPGRRFTR